MDVGMAGLGKGGEGAGAEGLMPRGKAIRPGGLLKASVGNEAAAEKKRPLVALTWALFSSSHESCIQWALGCAAAACAHRIATAHVRSAASQMAAFITSAVYTSPLAPPQERASVQNNNPLRPTRHKMPSRLGLDSAAELRAI